DGDRMVFFGFLHQHVDVSVPAGSRLEIVRCSGADVAGMTGSVSVRSQDGRISLDDLRGDVDAHTDDGRIAANDLAIARSGSLSTNDGSIHLSFARGADVTVDASTSDGSLEIDGTRVPHDDSDAVRHTLRVGAGTGNLRVSTDDGSIHITTHGVQ
ncbi:MAG TPA: DUF4097 family beta strand repeat-containing protein, partial [Candidatus Baltobacteraceae bacterium]|nr:DUF4097 family beta strand repeat-containing protein [Candidatus Baltobacteraceae bacterium]